MFLLYSVTEIYGGFFLNAHFSGNTRRNLIYLSAKRKDRRLIINILDAGSFFPTHRELGCTGFVLGSLTRASVARGSEGKAVNLLASGSLSQGFCRFISDLCTRWPVVRYNYLQSQNPFRVPDFHIVLTPFPFPEESTPPTFFVQPSVS